MKIFRIARNKYATGLMASGRAARWNKDNQQVIYAGQSRALASLELLTHKNAVQVAFEYKVMVIDICENEKLYTRLADKDLETSWQKFDSCHYTQNLGSNWYTRNQSLILQVPSALIPSEYNYILNLNHQDYNPENVKILTTEPYFWDKRLF